MRVVRGIDQASGRFELSVSERRPGSGLFSPGQSAVIFIDDQVLITGYVDSVRRTLTGSAHTVALSGRDKIADMVDGAPFQVVSSWKSLNIVQLANVLAEPYGISVLQASDIDLEPFEKVDHTPGESAWETIEPLARLRAVLLMSDGLGNLVLTNAGHTKANTQVIEGQNILEVNYNDSWEDRFSEYNVRGQSSGTDAIYNDSPIASVANQEGQAFDPNINRFRPITIIESKAADAHGFQQRAEWEARVRMATGLSFSVKVPGWVQSDGTIWEPNTLVRTKIPTFGIDFELLTERVVMNQGDTGTFTTLTLVLPEAYAPEPVEDADSEEAILRRIREAAELGELGL